MKRFFLHLCFLVDQPLDIQTRRPFRPVPAVRTDLSELEARR